MLPGDRWSVSLFRILPRRDAIGFSLHAYGHGLFSDRHVSEYHLAAVHEERERRLGRALGVV
jgi:hypothetical protein